MSDSASDSRNCPKCRSVLPADTAEGLCPRCLMGEAMQPTGPKLAWEPPTASELGELLPEYDVEKLLGRGGMGAVYKGRQKSLDRPVAVKILSATLDESDQGFAERFKNEARALGKLKHPGIVGVYDFGTAADGLLYIVMEYIDGTDVAKMIAKEGRLHTDHAMAITAHVCDALAYAHERGIIHRDIKPANIMVGYDGNVKVADFGLAKMTHSAESGLTQSGMAMGTMHYMAPEALTLGTRADHRADIYAVGVMLYQMLTGKLPKGLFKLPSLQIKGLDSRYDGIIAKALREDREARYQTILEMRADLDGILTQPVLKMEPPSDFPDDVASYEETEDEPIWTPDMVVDKTKSSPMLSLLALLVVLGAAFAVWMLLNPPANTPSQPAMTDADAPADKIVMPTDKSPRPLSEPPSSPETSPPVPSSTPTATPAAPPTAPVVLTMPQFVQTPSIEVIQIPATAPVPLNDAAVMSAVDKSAQLQARVSKVEPVNPGDGRRILLEGTQLTLYCARQHMKAVFGDADPAQTLMAEKFITAQGVVKLVNGRPEVALTGSRQLEPYSPDYLPYSPLCAPMKVFANASLSAMGHGKEPVSSRDASITPLIFDRLRGALESVQHDFAEPKTVNGCEVYWGLGEGLQLPRFWKVLYLDEDGFWRPVSAAPAKPEADHWNLLAFQPVRTKSIRLMVQLGWSTRAALLEWKIQSTKNPAPPALPPPTELWLDDLLPVRLRNKQKSNPFMVNTYTWWQVQRGVRVLLDGAPCNRYLFAQAPCAVTYVVPPGYTRFTATAIGPQFVGKSVHSWTHRVLADDKLLFHSNSLETYAGKQAEVNVVLPHGTKTITLVTDNNGKFPDHAIWAHPRLIRAP